MIRLGLGWLELVNFRNAAVLCTMYICCQPAHLKAIRDYGDILCCRLVTGYIGDCLVCN